MNEAHPFIEFRNKLRQAVRQYRYNNDNSASLFQPDMGFVNAYDLALVNAAIAEYEASLATAYIPQGARLTILDEGVSIIRREETQPA